MIRNILFIVEGKTEGLANVFGKGLLRKLRNEDLITCKISKPRLTDFKIYPV